MNKELFQEKIYKLFELAKLHSWCRQIHDEIKELEQLNDPTKSKIIEKIVNEKIQSKDSSREELVLSSALLFKLTRQYSEISNLLFNKLRDRLFFKDYQFLMFQLFQDKSPVPGDLTYDITERVFVGIKDAIKKAIQIDRVMSTKNAEKTVLYFTLLLCMPKLNKENKAMLLLLLSRIDVAKPDNLETVIINFLKNIKITGEELEEIKESENQEREKEDVITPQKKEKPSSNQVQLKPSIAKIIINILEEQKQTYMQDSKQQPGKIKSNNKNIPENTFEKNLKAKTEAAFNEPFKGKVHFFDNRHQSRNENTLNKHALSSNGETISKKINNLQNKPSSTKESIASAVTQKANEVKTLLKQLFEILFGPLSETIKDLIDNILRGKISSKEDIQKQKDFITLKPTESNKKEVRKVKKQKLKLLKKSGKITLPLTNKIKFSILAIITCCLAFFLLIRIDFSKFNFSNLIKTETSLEKDISKISKKPIIEDKNSTSNLEKKTPPFDLEKSGNHIIWKIHKNDNVWKFYQYLQNNTLPYPAIINKNETWPQFLIKLQNLNPDKKDLNLIYPGEKLKVY